MNPNPSPLRKGLLATSLTALILCSCDQAANTGSPAPQKTERDQAATTISPSTPSTPTDSTLPPVEDLTANAEMLADHIHGIPGDDLPALMEAIGTKTDPAVRQALLTTVYEESDLRPPSIRLPLLLEIARTKDVNPDVQATIMGELGATLKTEHGTSWADWSLAIEEYLAENHGLIRVE